MEYIYKNLKKISVGFLASPCRCACMHCKGRGGGGAGEKRENGAVVPYPVARDVVMRFWDWKRRNNYKNLLITFGAADVEDFEGNFDMMRLVGELYARHGASFNGMRMRTPAELDDFFRSARAAGYTTCFTTFYGTREFHDRFANRAGDYDLMLNTVRAIAANGMKNVHTLFVSRSTLPYLDELSATLDAMPGEKELQYRPILNKSDVLTDESERLHRAEFEALPPRYRQSDHYRMKTRAEWLEHIQSPAFRELTKNYHLLDVTFDVGAMDLDRFYSVPVEEYLDEAIENEVRRRLDTPTMPQLARLYGGREADSDLMYDLFDLHMEWKYLYRREHPGVRLYYGQMW